MGAEWEVGLYKSLLLGPVQARILLLIVRAETQENQQKFMTSLKAYTLNQNTVPSAVFYWLSKFHGQAQSQGLETFTLLI
jgi:hypothetical protein